MRIGSGYFDPCVRAFWEWPNGACSCFSLQIGVVLLVIFRIVGCAGIVCRARSVQLSCVHLSACPSVSFGGCCGFAAEGPAWPVVSSSRAPARRAAANAGNATLSADMGS